MKNNKSIAIVGGGMMGITAAMELSKQNNYHVTILEKNDHIGGLSSSFSWNGVTWDRFYHVVLSTDSYLIDFITELGLADEFFWRETKSGFFGANKLVSMSTVRDFITFPFLSFWHKFRLAMGIVLSTWIKDATKLDRVYVREWLTRVFGRRVYEQIWDPLLRSKLGAYREKTSAAFIWATINRLYGARQGKNKVERMGHVRGGYTRILERAHQCLESVGMRVLLNQEVISLGISKSESSKPLYVRTTSQQYEFDHVFLTLPAPDILRIVEFQKGDYWSHLSAISYLGVVCVLVILKRSLSPYYVINLLDKSLPFTGIIEATNVVASSDVNNTHLVYLPKYVTTDDPLWEASDQEVSQQFLYGLSRVYPDVAGNDIHHYAVFRERHVQPLQEVDYLRRSIGFRTPVKGLYIANTSMIYNSTLNNNAVVKLAQSAVQDFLARA